MQAGRFAQRLLVWQLSEQLRLETMKLMPPLDGDSKLQTSIEDAARAISRNIGEAFAADRDREFARFVRLARASTADLHDGFRVALMKRYVNELDLRGVRELLARLYPALSALLSQREGQSARSSEARTRRRA